MSRGTNEVLSIFIHCYTILFDSLILNEIAYNTYTKVYSKRVIFFKLLKSFMKIDNYNSEETASDCGIVDTSLFFPSGAQLRIVTPVIFTRVY